MSTISNAAASTVGVPQDEPADAWLQHIYAAIAGAIIVVDPTGTVVWANAAAGAIAGIPAHALTGVRLVDQPWLIHDVADQDLPSTERPIPRAIATGKPQRRFMMRLIRNVDSQTRWLLLDAVPLLDPRGAVRQVVVSGIEMTAQRQAEDELRRSEERFRALTEHSTDLVSIIDASGVFTYVSPSFSRLLGVEPATLLGVSGFDAIHPDDHARLHGALEAAHGQGGLTPMVTFRRRHALTGAWHDLETVGNNQLDNPAIRGIILNSRDVTARKEMEQRLLTDRRLEREEVAQAVHDGPVWLLNELRGLLAPGALVDLSAVRAKANELEHSLRTTVLSGAASSVLSVWGLPDALRDLVAQFTPNATAAGCALVVDVDEDVATLSKNDGFVLHHIARQALMNAIQHSRARQIMVRLWADGETVALEVRDDGIGMPAEWRSTMRPGHRGLRTAVDLVGSLSGASLEIDAGPGGAGTILRARIPFRRGSPPGEPDARRRGGLAATETGQLEGGDDRIGASIRILIADDQAVVRDGVRRVLEEDPDIVVVGEADTGTDAVRLAHDLRPDLVLLDIQMPGRNGLQAAADIRERLASPPRLLVLSGYWDEVSVRHARAAGVQGYLLKTATGVCVRQAVRDVMDGAMVMDADVRRIMDRQSYDARGRFAQYANGAVELTTAEQDMLEWMMRGVTYAQIAKETQHSISTINSHVQHVCEKLGVRTRLEAVSKALVMGLLRLPDEPVDSLVAEER